MAGSEEKAKFEQEIIITPPAPHSKKQALIYQSYRMPGVREIWVACGTKFGKTLSASVAQATVGAERPGTKWRWVAPIYTQACLAMDDYFPKILPPSPHTEFKKSNLEIIMPSQNTIFEFWHAQKPSSLEGAAVNGYVFDEASRMAPEIKASARTTTTRTGGPMLFISYPFGKNWFYQGCMEAEEHMKWSFKHGKQPEKIFLHAKTADNPFIDRKIIEDAQRELPARLFRQFYLAEFVDDGQVFIGFRDRLWGEELDLVGERQRWIAPDSEKSTVVIGADWAKTVDWTVFFAIDTETRKVVGFERFHRLPYTEAIRRLVLFSRRFKTVLTVRHDKTGVGSAIDDQLSMTELPYEGVVFTNQSKADMVSKLMTSLEIEGQLWLPRWGTLLSELDFYDVESTPSGSLVYGAPSGKHDDCISALMLANTALLQYGIGETAIRFLEDLPHTEQAKTELEKYYQSLGEDDD